MAGHAPTADRCSQTYNDAQATGLCVIDRLHNIEMLLLEESLLLRQILRGPRIPHEARSHYTWINSECLIKSTNPTAQQEHDNFIHPSNIQSTDERRSQCVQSKKNKNRVVHYGGADGGGAKAPLLKSSSKQNEIAQALGQTQDQRSWSVQESLPLLRFEETLQQRSTRAEATILCGRILDKLNSIRSPLDPFNNVECVNSSETDKMAKRGSLPPDELECLFDSVQEMPSTNRDSGSQSDGSRTSLPVSANKRKPDTDVGASDTTSRSELALAEVLEALDDQLDQVEATTTDARATLRLSRQRHRNGPNN